MSQLDYLEYLDLHADANTAALCLLRRLGNHMTLLICSYYKPPPGAKYWPRYGSCVLGKANKRRVPEAAARKLRE